MSNRQRSSGSHHPRVFRSGCPQLWFWECGCGAAGHSVHHGGQRAAAIAALVHVQSQASAR